MKRKLIVLSAVLLCTGCAKAENVRYNSVEETVTTESHAVPTTTEAVEGETMDLYELRYFVDKDKFYDTSEELKFYDIAKNNEYGIVIKSAQVSDNLETFGKFQPLTEAEEEAVEKAADLIRSRVKNGCTSCRYCMPCPFGVNIPEMFSIWNNCAMFDEEEKAKKAYAEQKVQDASADLCKKCGACEKACPQGLSIRADLEKVAKELNTEEA